MGGGYYGGYNRSGMSKTVMSSSAGRPAAGQHRPAGGAGVPTMQGPYDVQKRHAGRQWSGRRGAQAAHSGM